MNLKTLLVSLSLTSLFALPVGAVNRYQGEGFNENETKVLNYFQERGITDPMALSVILGNIKQESTFRSNVCEGGAIVRYEHCHRGGYGIIQWTTSYRYWGLGNHAKAINGDPSSLDTQLSYVFTERRWKQVEQKFKTKGQSLDFYMKAAYGWLGWGKYGNRGYYSQNYYERLSPS